MRHLSSSTHAELIANGAKVWEAHTGGEGEETVSLVNYSNGQSWLYEHDGAERVLHAGGITEVANLGVYLRKWGALVTVHRGKVHAFPNAEAFLDTVPAHRKEFAEGLVYGHEVNFN